MTRTLLSRIAELANNKPRNGIENIEMDQRPFHFFLLSFRAIGKTGDPASTGDSVWLLIRGQPPCLGSNLTERRRNALATMKGNYVKMVVVFCGIGRDRGEFLQTCQSEAMRGEAQATASTSRVALVRRRFPLAPLCSLKYSLKALFSTWIMSSEPPILTICSLKTDRGETSGCRRAAR
jgi:hypothetical protein